ncbi:MAG TPA: succinate dehydrogenase, hydrophobic membrane anchor protein [Gammaproteobacteria bacterium]|jgi:succinate dehydrogenase / fumarate reductase membrane anchor subunit
MSLASPLSRVRGLGSAKSGTHHWWQQRLTAVALVPLGLWFIYSLIAVDVTNHASVVRWLREPVTVVLLILLLGALLHHAQLGVQVVIEDYVEPEWQKLACIVMVKFLTIFAGLAGLVALMFVSLGLG